MPVRIERTVKQIIENDQEQPKQEMTVHAIIKCDGPKCPTGICVGDMEWTETGNGEGVPDGFFRTLTLVDAYGIKKVFLTKDCLRDFMREYTAPLSPREHAEIMKNNQQVELEKTKSISDAAAEAISGDLK